jgi:hypothetical protein
MKSKTEEGIYGGVIHARYYTEASRHVQPDVSMFCRSYPLQKVATFVAFEYLIGALLRATKMVW